MPIKVTTSSREYSLQDGVTYYLSPNFPKDSTAQFVYVNRVEDREVIAAIQEEEGKGYYVNSVPLRGSTLHAVMSYKDGPQAKPPPRNAPLPTWTSPHVTEMGDLLSNIIKGKD